MVLQNTLENISDKIYYSYYQKLDGCFTSVFANDFIQLFSYNSLTG